MQQMMQAFGQMFTAPLTMMADTFSRSLQTFGGESARWSRTIGGWARRGDCCRGDDRWDCGERWRDDCGDRWRDDCGDRWRDDSGDRWRDDCSERSRDDCGDRWGGDSGWRDRDRRCGDRCSSCGGWGCDDDWCYRRGRRGYDRSSDRVRLVEFSLVSVRRGRDRDRKVLEHGQRVVRGDESKEEFKNWVISEFAPKGEDTRNLRVYVRILDSWCKESWDYEEEKIEALREIRDRLDSRSATKTDKS